MNIHKDHAALLKKTAAFPTRYERRDAPPAIEEVKKTLDGINTAFEAFKKKNDERLEELEKRGGSDPITEEELKKINDEIDSLSETKKQMENLLDLRERLDELETRVARPGGAGGDSEVQLTPEQIEHRELFSAWVRDPSDEQAKLNLKNSERALIETRAIDTSVGATGGFAVPEEISRTIEQNLLDISAMRNIADVVTAGTPDFKRLVDVRGTAFGWVGEGDARAETGTPSLAEVAPTFGTIYSYPKATEESLQDMFFDVESWLTDSAVEHFDQGEGAAFVAGDGTNKPTGFLDGTPVVTDDGARAFGVLQYVPGGTAALLDNSDPFIDVTYKLKKGYRRNAMWTMNKGTVAAVRKLKDGDSDYLWRPGMEMGQPDQLLGYGVEEMEDMPDIAANSFSVAFGDFRAGYLIVDLVGVRMTRDEITSPGQVKFYIRKRVGGITKKSEAIKLIRTATT